MPQTVFRTPLPVPVAELAAWHERPGALERLTPPWDPVEIAHREGTIYEGSVTLRMAVGPLRVRWVARHHGGEPGHFFFDEQEAGPFRRFAHTHRFEAAPGGARMVDEIAWEPPRFTPPPVTTWITHTLTRAFRFRHRRLAEDLQRHAGVRPRRFVVSGASGMVGRQLVAFLESGGHRVDRLVRRAGGPGEIAWDPAAGRLDPAAIDGADAVVHLAGANIAQRWSTAAKAEILESRVAGTELLARTLAGLSHKPEVFVSASAVGWYGDHRGAPLDEGAPAAEVGFLPEVCRRWEAAADPARAAGIRTVHPRLGVVLSPDGGALARMLTPARLGLGGPLGDGTQPFPWITLDDAIYALHALATGAYAGPVNLVAPDPVDQRGLARTLGAVLGRPAVLPLPAPVVRAVFGEMGQAALLEGASVAPAALLTGGFRFAHPTLDGALRFVLGYDE